MSSNQLINRKDSLRERALQVLNLKYPIESDIKDSYRRRTLEYHPDRHPDAKDNLKKANKYKNEMTVINQSYELLMDFIAGQMIDINKYHSLEDTALVQSLLPENVKPAPLKKTEIELWIEKYGNGI